MPGALPSIRQMIEPERTTLDELERTLRYILCRTGGENLITNHSNGLTRGGQLDHRLHEVATLPANAMLAVQATGADDEVTRTVCPNEILPSKLADAIGGKGPGGIAFHIGCRAIAIEPEDIIRTEVYQRGTCCFASPRYLLNAEGIRRKGCCRVFLCIIHLVVRCTIDDQLRLMMTEEALNRARLSNIDIRTCGCKKRSHWQQSSDLAPELTLRAKDNGVVWIHVELPYP